MTHALRLETSLETSPAGFFAGLRKRFNDYLLYRRTLGQLKALTARDLADLDIDAAYLDSVARQAVYGA